MKPIEPRKKPRQERSKATVEAIVEAAARIFITDGFDGATTNSIARTAGVSVGSLYQYFPNKEALAGELIDRHLAELLGILVAELNQVANSPVAEAVPALVRAMFEAHHRAPELHTVLIEAGSRVGMDARKRQVLERFHQLLRVYLEAHRDEIVLGDLDRGSYVLVYAVESLMREVTVAPPPFPLDDVVDSIATMCLAFLNVSELK
ncbi:MAG: AcrR family transcriptional regulator [Myxococcota bacterium]|jgi:AcrR family transcriptional regulator